MPDDEPVPYSPITTRPPLRWPGGARVAFWVVPNIELYELVPPRNPLFSTWSRVPDPPDVMAYSHRDFGNRVGFWRLLEVLDAHAVRPTASLNLAVLEELPQIRDAMVERGWALMAHGLYNTRFLYGLERAAERQLLRQMREIAHRRAGVELRGAFGPHASLSPRSMDLLAEEGYTYAADWLVDDQPFPIAVRQGRLIGVPYTFELNDGPLFLGSHEGEELVQRVRDQVDVLLAEGAESGRVLCLALHPFLSGQPHRARFVDEALRYVLAQKGVWAATGDEIAEWYLAHVYEDAVAALPR